MGEGRLIHTEEGLRLCGCDGALDVLHKSAATYSVNVDFNFYEIGDVISFGDNRAIYYAFPRDKSIPVAKIRLATEELYRMKRTRTEKRDGKEGN